ncbi:MAG: hypothetical protein GMKNLPBB_00211 [Myxococcota bacterium]|nr:hypothetical protein [Myxococcota bacterium]
MSGRGSTAAGFLHSTKKLPGGPPVINVPQMNIRRRRQFAALLLLAGTVTALAAAEIALRIQRFGDPNPHDAPLMPDLLPYRPPPQLIRETRYGNDCRINNHGYRGADWQIPPQGNARRIMVIGDSFVNGAGVDDTETLPFQLELRLQQKYGVPFTVYNIGLNGSNMQQAWIHARKWVPLLKPEIVLTVVVANDGDVMTWNPDPIETCGVDWTWYERLHWASLSHWYVYRSLRGVLVDKACTGPKRCLFDWLNDGVPTRCFDHSFDQMLNEIIRGGAYPAAAFYPAAYDESRDGLDDLAKEPRLIEGLRRRSAKRGVPFISLEGVYANVKRKDLAIKQIYSTWDPHPNGVAHARAAAILVNFLDDIWRGRVSASPQPEGK